MFSFFTAWILYWELSQRHFPVWIDMLVWDPFANYLDHGTCCSIEVRVLCMLCHKMIDEYTSDITTNVCKHINVRFAFQSTNTFVHSNAVFLFLFFHCMSTDGLSQRWRDTSPFEQYGLTWDPFTNFYCLDQGTFCYIEVSYLHCVNCVKHCIDEHISDRVSCLCIEAFCCCKVSTVILMLCSFCYCMYAVGFSRRWRDTAPFEQCGLTCYFWDPFHVCWGI